MEKLGVEYKTVGEYYANIINTAYIVKLSADEYEALTPLCGDLVVNLQVARGLIDAHRRLHPEKPNKKK